MNFVNIKCHTSDGTIDRTVEKKIILQGKDLWFNYPGHEPIICGVNVEIREGLVSMILGRSGSGKTTLLKLLAGIILPRSGSVVPTEYSRELYNQTQSHGIAYIPQSLGLVRNMNVLDNTLVGALGYSKTAPSIFKQFPTNVLDLARSTLKDLGLSNKTQRMVCTLSGGERQRVAIARALMLKPRIILADEFVSQLDPITCVEILNMMKRLAKNQKISFLVTTHDMDLVKKFSDRVIIMKDGKIFCDHATTGMVLEDMTGCIR